MATTTRPAEPAAPASAALTHGVLPAWGPLAVLLIAALVSAAVGLVAGFDPYAFAAIAVVVYLLAINLVSRRVEGRRKAADRTVTGVVYAAFGLAMLPLFALVYTVLTRGVPGLTAEFLTTSMRGVIGPGGGILHALVGTLLVTAFATLISVPIGVLCAIYLVEYGRGRLARAVTFFVDVMTGIPSIVAGLFAYALFALFFGSGVRLGVAGSVALSVLMVPVVVRSSEEMLKLVPNELREAAYALGVPRWRTVVKVVIPTAIGGITTGVTLAVARVIGETAPLLLVAGATTSINANLFDGRMMTLPVFAYNSYVTPGIPPEAGYERAWSAALVLIVLVMVLNLGARLVSRFLAPTTSR
jgi:phosphate transport system permease protein